MHGTPGLGLSLPLGSNPYLTTGAGGGANDCTRVGFFIGDGAGVGKGRQISGIILGVCVWVCGCVGVCVLSTSYGGVGRVKGISSAHTYGDLCVWSESRWLVLRFALKVSVRLVSNREAIVMHGNQLTEAHSALFLPPCSELGARPDQACVGVGVS